jgi:hypothetical protein
MKTARLRRVFARPDLQGIGDYGSSDEVDLRPFLVLDVVAAPSDSRRSATGSHMHPRWSPLILDFRTSSF